MKIVALAGGVGGARLAHGFSKILNPNEFTVIVNTGDDFSHFGLYISPDIDTVCYMLADISNSQTGWGRKNESFSVFETLKEFDAPDWFLLGDKDLALHLERTRLLEKGYSLSKITDKLRRYLGIENQILPMSDDEIRTIVNTVEFGEISFQEYFVKYKFQPRTIGFRFNGIEKARPTQAVIESLEKADLVVICPSNPFVSINPILSLPKIRAILRNKFVIGVSPIIGGKAVKGPLALMLENDGLPVNPFSVKNMYEDFLNIFIIDKSDGPIVKDYIQPSSIIVSTSEILIKKLNAQIQLANKIIDLYEKYK